MKMRGLLFKAMKNFKTVKEHLTKCGALPSVGAPCDSTGHRCVKPALQGNSVHLVPAPPFINENT